MEPLVSCILVTRDRPSFFRQALKYYHEQTYARSELIVVDDGESSVADFCRAVSGVTYIRLAERSPTGSKLNLGIEASRGEILQKIDDDDYYGPEFLSKASAALLAAEEPNALVAWCCFGIFIAGEQDLFHSGHGWHAGGTLCFHRALWKQHAFRDVFASSDSWFLRDNRPVIHRVCAADQYVVCRHGKNTWNRLRGYDAPEQYFRRRRFPGTLEQIVGEGNAAFYRALCATAGSSDA